MNDCMEYRELLSGLLDGELTAEETARVNKHLTRCDACQREYETLCREAERLDELSVREPQDEALEGFWRLPFSGFARNAGLVMVIGGYLAFLLYGSIQFFTDEGEWFVGKFAVAAIIIGGLIIFGIVLIERVISYRSDPYKELKR